MLLQRQLYDCILVCETWLDPAFPDSLLLGGSSQYKVLRCDRNERIGGGCAAFILSSLQPQRVRVHSHIEALCFDIVSPALSLRTFLFYRPPQSDHSILTSLSNALSDLCLEAVGEFLAVGDLNLGGISWSQSTGSNNAEQEFVNSLHMSNLTQVITQPTRIDKILDILLTSDPQLLLSSKVVEPFAFSDHNALEFEVPWSHFPSPIRSYEFLDYKKADYDSVNEALYAVHWYEIFVRSNRVEDFWCKLHSCLSLCIRLYVPRRVVTTRDSSSELPEGLRRLEGRLRLLFRRHGAISAKYCRLEKIYAKAVRKWAVKIENGFLSNYSQGKLFSFVKSKRRVDNSLPDLLSPTGALCRDDLSKAEAFNEFFSSVFTQDNGSLPPLPSRTQQRMSQISFSTYYILQALRELKAKLASGPDGIPAVFLRRVAEAVSYPLSLLFEFSLKTGEIPALWKTSTVTPIPKKGANNVVSNYRPISKQSTFLKIMEKVIVKQLLFYLDKNRLLTDFQFGFRPGRSVTTQMLTCLDNWTKNFKKGTDVAFLDFKKAFDSVSHPKLLHKLSSYGISGNLLCWIKSYLSHRSQKVAIGTCSSTASPITSGVLQGSCLGPLLFLLFINDLPDSLQDLDIAMFADDVKLYSTEPHLLQQALFRIEEWCKDWQLSLSAEKCSILSISPTVTLPGYPFRLNDIILASSKLQRDLGILVPSNLQFSDHYRSIVKKASFAAYCILKMFTSGRHLAMSQAFSVYVRPILETFSQVWNPSKSSDIATLESVQRRFTRQVYMRCGLPMAPYPDRLLFLGLRTLEQRRLILDLSLAHKLFFHPDMPGSHLLTRKPPTRELRSKLVLLAEPQAVGPRRHFFPNRVSSSWNTLSDPFKSVSLKTFKTNLSFNL
jgi:hypothetical protein